MPSCLSFPPALQRETQGSAESPPGSQKKATNVLVPKNFRMDTGICALRSCMNLSDASERLEAREAIANYFGKISRPSPFPHGRGR